jgi:hypothetical protein
MTIYQDTLREMIGDVDEQVENIVANVSQIDTIINDLQDQIDAVTNAVTDVCQTNVVDQLENIKLPAFQELYAGAYTEYDGTFGDVGYGNSLTGWRIKAPAPLPIPPLPPDPDIVVYEYGGAGWDSDATITKGVGDWDFGNDYLTRPLTSGASYGLIPYQSNLNTAKSMLQANSSKLTNSKTIFADYI